MTILFRRSGSAQLPVALTWPSQTVGYQPTLPNHGAYGMDANGGGLPSTVIFVTSLANTNSGAAAPSLGSNVYEGTWEYAWKFNNSTTRHKIIVPLVSGWINFGRSINSTAGIGNMSYWGQAAPGPGLYIRNSALRLNGGSDMRVWHLPVYMGDEAGGLGADARDCIQVGSSGLTPSQIVLINCECNWGIDELMEAYYPVDLLTMVYCSFAEPLHVPPDFLHSGDPPGTDHGFGPIIGGGGFVDRVCAYRNLWAHSTDRAPLTAANRYAHANNLHYNHGRPGGGKGEGVNILDNGSHNPTAMYSNVVRNLFVRGPENNASLCAARTNGTLPTDSHGHSEGNVQHGWTAPANQDAFFTTAGGGYLQGSLTTAWPSGWGSSYEGTLAIASNPLSPTTAEKLAFADLVLDSVGAKPSERAGYGRIGAYRTQIENAISGVGQSFQFVNSVSEAGGWFTLPEETISDVTSPGADWHEPIPLGSDRDDVLLSGTFSNGASKVGYTKLEAWGIEQHYYVGGQ